MSWDTVEVGDLIEYHVMGSKRDFGIYLGLQPEDLDYSDGMITGLPAMHILYKDGIVYVPVTNEWNSRVSVRSSIKRTKG